MHTDIHALGGIRTHDPSVRALDCAATLTGTKYLNTQRYRAT
jgi:hypothetical protein